MRMISIALIFVMWTAIPVNSTPYQCEILRTAENYSYVREQTNRNDHPMIDRWLGDLGLDNASITRRGRQGYSWCMAFVQGVYKESYAAHGRKHPLPRSARCADVWKLAKKDKYRYKCITAKDVEIGAAKLAPADVAIFSNRKISDNFNGHTEIVIKPTPKAGFDAWGGNVGASNEASQQREQTGVSLKTEKNGGVRLKHRTAKKASPAFQIEGFIRTLDK